MYSVVGGDGQVYGPADMRTLEQWVREGRISAATRIIEVATGHGTLASNLPGLSHLFLHQTQMYGSTQMGNPGATAQMPPGTPHQNPFQQGSQHSPYVHNPYSNNPYARPQGAQWGQPKQKVVAILLAFFLGCLGIHRFYLGHTGSGVAMLLITVLTCGYGSLITGIWALIDLIMIATGSLAEANGQPLI